MFTLQGFPTPILSALTFQGTTVTMWTDAAPLTALAGAPRVIAEEATSVTIEWDSRNREAGGFIVEYRYVACNLLFMG